MGADHLPQGKVDRRSERGRFFASFLTVDMLSTGLKDPTPRESIGGVHGKKLFSQQSRGGRLGGRALLSGGGRLQERLLQHRDRGVEIEQRRIRRCRLDVDGEHFPRLDRGDLCGR